MISHIDTPLVTVLVPVYNNEAMLPTLLESLKGIQYPRECLEVLIVNNNSTDQTAKLLDQTDFTILFESEPGAGTARNRGIQVARGEFIACTDSDCVVDPSWIQDLLAGFAHPSVGAVAGTIQPYELTHPVERFEALELKSPGHCPHHPEFLPTACTANVMYRADVFKQVGGFLNRSGGEETDLNWRMQTQTPYRIEFLETGGLVYHRYRQDLKAFCRSQRVKAQTLVDLHKRWNLKIPTGRRELFKACSYCLIFVPTIVIQSLKQGTYFLKAPVKVLSNTTWEAYLKILVAWIRFQGIREGWRLFCLN